MAVENDADRAAFFDTDDFGTVATINGTAVNVIFDAEYLEALDIAGNDPQVQCRTSDLDAITPTVAVGATVVVNSTSYTVAAPPKPDGTGITTLKLNEA